MISPKKPSLTIPCHWDRDTLRRISLLKGEDIYVSEVYGSLAKGGPVGHGRSSSSVKDISPEEAVSFRNWIKKEFNLKFTYLINAPFNLTDSQELRKSLDQYLDWIIFELRPNALTIASLDLMREIRRRDPNIEIHISTIAGVKNVEDLKKYLEVRPSRLVPHHDIGKDWANLLDLVNFGQKNGIEIELLSTESCLLHCPQREEHYLYLSGQGQQDQPFHVKCNLKKLIAPREFLLSGGVIRPEDIRLYEEMGVSYFKISGRSKSADWLPEVVDAYMRRNYDGNLIRLLGIDPSLKAEEWIWISNKSLDGYAENFPYNSSYDNQNSYADHWITKLYLENNFVIKDDTKYTIEGENACLKVISYGEKSMQIVGHYSKESI